MPYALPPAPPAIVALAPRQATSSTASRPVCVAAHRRAAWPPSTRVRTATRRAVARAVGARVTSITPGGAYGTWYARTRAGAPFAAVTVSIARASGCGQVYPSPSPRPVVCCTADPSRAATTQKVRIKAGGKRIKNPRKRSW